MEPEFDEDSEICLGPGDGGSLPSPCSNQEVHELQDKSKTLPSRLTISCLAEVADKKKPKVKMKSLIKCFISHIIILVMFRNCLLTLF